MVSSLRMASAPSPVYSSTAISSVPYSTDASSGPPSPLQGPVGLSGRAEALGSHAKVLGAFLAENSKNLATSPVPNHVRESLAYCATLFKDLGNGARAKEGFARLEALSALLGFHQALIALPPGPTAGGLASQLIGISSAAIQQEAVACLRRQYVDLRLSVEAKLNAKMAMSGGPAASNPIHAIEASLIQLNQISMDLGQHPDSTALLFTCHDVAEKCCNLLRELSLTHTLAKESPTAYHQPTVTTLAPFLGLLPQNMGLPPLAFASLIALKKGPDGHSSQKIFESTSKDIFELGSNLSGRAGAHGRVHLTRLQSSPRDKLITKVQRSQVKLGSGLKSSSTGTEVISLQSMLDRTMRAEAACAKIDRTIQYSTKLFASPHGPLRGFRADKVTTALKHHFVDGFGKYYQVMPAMAGDLADLSVAAQKNGVSQSALHDVRVSIGAQSFFQLAALHGRSWDKHRLAHRDLKLTNILFDQHGAIRLIDFDESFALDRRGYAKEAYRRQGSLLSPEMNLPSLRNGRGLGSAYDVWTLGTVLLEFGFPHDAGSPFVNQPMGGHPALSNPTLAMAAYASWYENRVARSKALVWPLPAATLEESQKTIQKAIKLASFAPRKPSATDGKHIATSVSFFEEYFNQRALHDPVVVTTVLTKALHPDPSSRVSVRKMAGIFIGMMDNMDNTRRKIVANVFYGASLATELSV